MNGSADNLFCATASRCHRQSFVLSDSGSSPEALITLRIARRTVRISSSVRCAAKRSRWKAVSSLPSLEISVNPSCGGFALEEKRLKCPP